MSFSQMTTAAFSSNRKCPRVIGNRPDRLAAAKENRLSWTALRAQLDFGPLPPEANSRSSHTFRDHLRNIDGAVFYFFDLESQ
jgi:hypothetical protein